jgi:BlaI family transcriptional regulator, penicillinase repressor
MARQPDEKLSRRERQIMDILYQREQASAAEVLEDLPDPPSYTSVRTLLRILEEKGHLKHKQQGNRYIYLPTVPRDRARRSALQRVLQTFFDGSTEQAVATLLDLSAPKLSDADLDRLANLIDEAKQDRLTDLIEKARKEGR